MDLFGRFRKLDSSLQRGLDNGFARVFGGEVVPAEIDELLKQEVEDALMEDRSGVLHAPSTFEVYLASRDHDNLVSQRPDLAHELRDRLHRFIRNEGWTTSAPVTVDLVRDDGMHTGQLKCRSSFTAVHQHDSAPAARQDAAPHAAPPAASQAASQAEPRATSHRAPEWPRPEPNSGRSPVARPYDADSADSADSADGADSAANEASSHGTGAGAAGTGAAAGAAGTGTAGGGSLAGLAHPQGRASSWGQPAPEPASRPADRPESAPETEVVPGPSATAVAGADGATGAGDQGAEQRTVTLHLQDGSDRTYVLSLGSNTVGRGNQVDFRLPDTGVSRRHGDITWDGFDAVYTDLHSTNGTTVNDIPVENWLLADGDVISLGHSSIEVRFS